MAATMTTEMPKLHRGAAGYYTAQLADPKTDSLIYVTVQQTDVETREMYARHGWYWTVDMLGDHCQSEWIYDTKADALAALQRNWSQIVGC